MPLEPPNVSSHGLPSTALDSGDDCIPFAQFETLVDESKPANLDDCGLASQDSSSDDSTPLATPTPSPPVATQSFDPDIALDLLLCTTDECENVEARSVDPLTTRGISIEVACETHKTAEKELGELTMSRARNRRQDYDDNPWA